MPRIADTAASLDTAFTGILQKRLSRREVMRGGVSAALASFAPLGLLGCDNSTDPLALPGARLGFAPVAKGTADAVAIPAGYSAQAIYRLGDPIAVAAAAYANDGTQDDFDLRAGDHHDGIHFFPLPRGSGSSSSGVLVMNHENITQAYLHPLGATSTPPRPEAEVRKEMLAHGVGIVEIARTGGAWAIVQDSPLNRRITPLTAMALAGPVRGTAYVKTAFSTDGTQARGTINNCAMGYTPWGTYLTCEENWNGYFRRGDDQAERSAPQNTALARYGIGNDANPASNRNWSTVTGAADQDVFDRWDITADAAQPDDGSGDYRNEANTFGWIVEIDPYDPAAVPRKRTALGRFAHEGAWLAPVVAGRPVVVYMGDDSRNEYIYKFVSQSAYDPATASGDALLDAGTLFVARFDADGSGVWIPLVHGSNGLTPDNATYPFADQADVLVNARLAADAVGATKMDRPEWAAVNPRNGEVYFTLTNNRTQQRPVANLDAANPRAYTDARVPSGSNAAGNVNGHIIRWRELAGEAQATTFTWDIFLFGAQSDADPNNVNVSVLTAENDFSSPDGLWFDPRGVLWIQTDDGAYTDVTNNQLLAAIPGEVGDGGRRAITSTVGNDSKTVETFVGKRLGSVDLRRFLVGPKEAEITGIAMTPDGRSLFVNIQHPGEDTPPDFNDPASFGSHWPEGGSARPRSATLVITRDDGGVIGL